MRTFFLILAVLAGCTAYHNATRSTQQVVDHHNAQLALAGE